MFYLAKFCRICIQTDVKLVDVDSTDVDQIKLSKKLEECTKMAIENEYLSNKICTQCVKKLRISYDFHNMCKKSSNILEGILSELIRDSGKVEEKFSNSEIRVALSPLNKSQHQRKRITKAERCSILKSLLSKKNEKSYSNEFCKGGLRNIINFTKTFDFGLNENSPEVTPLKKLAQFSENFFKQGFKEFKETILYIIENQDCSAESEDEDMFNSCSDLTEIKFEEVVIEPDIKVKTEFFEEEDTDYSEESNIQVKFEPEEYSDSLCSNENNNSLDNDLSLTDFVNNIRQYEYKRTFSPNSLRCRTRGNPYINPQLKRQFMLRSFQCKKCPRYFKSPGYLKAHLAKIHSSK